MSRRIWRCMRDYCRWWWEGVWTFRSEAQQATIVGVLLGLALSCWLLGL